MMIDLDWALPGHANVVTLAHLQGHKKVQSYNGKLYTFHFECESSERLLFLLFSWIPLASLVM